MSGKDFVLALRGLERVVSDVAANPRVAKARHTWANSSLSAIPPTVCGCVKTASKKISDPEALVKSVVKNAKASQENFELFLHGLKQYQAAVSRAEAYETRPLQSDTAVPDLSVKDKFVSDYVSTPQHDTSSGGYYSPVPPSTSDDYVTKPRQSFQTKPKEQLDKEEEEGNATSVDFKFKDVSIEEHDKSNEETTRSRPTKIHDSFGITKKYSDVESDFQIEARKSRKPIHTVPVKEPKMRTEESRQSQSLSSLSRERKVPASRIARLISYGSLGVGLGVGALAEVARRTLGMKNVESSGAIADGNVLLTEANASRIVDTLCRVRGAALKLGQMLSLQDNSMINPQLQVILERVRQSADFMPTWQMQRVLSQELGSDWRNGLQSFEEQPFAAASIGQVHRATLQDGKEVAIKIQYPGVAKGIDSDIDNLLGLLKVWNILPKGLYMENLAAVARKELKWEVDYIREAQCAKKFKKLVEPYQQFFVPEIIDSLSAERVLTSELIYGTSIDKLTNADQELRNWICEQLLRLALLEVFRFNFMQTDPNWSNFFYNDATKQLNLLDFGACREYSKYFVDHYLLVIKGAIAADYSAVLQQSRVLGFMTGYESKAMEDAHVEAAMALGEPFRHQGHFDFSRQETTRRLHSLIPVMVQHRLTPPPEESYSLHRKLSGVFLLCTKLRANIDCGAIFNQVLEGYQFKSDKVS